MNKIISNILEKYDIDNKNINIIDDIIHCTFFSKKISERPNIIIRIKMCFNKDLQPVKLNNIIYTKRLLSNNSNVYIHLDMNNYKISNVINFIRKSKLNHVIELYYFDYERLRNDMIELQLEFI